LLAFVRCQLVFDHGQIMRAHAVEVKNYLNAVKLLSGRPWN
jgi:hypothetical protein